MAESIGAAHIEITASAAKFTATMDQATAGVRTFTQTAAGNLRNAREASQSFEATLTTSMGKVGKSLQGAQGAIAATRQAMEAMGVKGSSAVSGLGTAVSSLLSTGFTPLGLAVAGVTAAISLFATSQRDTAAATDEATRALVKHREEWTSLLADVDRGPGKPAGSATERLRDRVQQMEEVRDMIAGFQSRNPGQDAVAALGLAPELSAFGVSDAGQLQGRIEGALAYLNAADERAYRERLENRLTLDLEYERKRNEEVRRLVASFRQRAPLPEQEAWVTGNNLAQPELPWNASEIDAAAAREASGRERDRQVRAFLARQYDGELDTEQVYGEIPVIEENLRAATAAAREYEVHIRRAATVEEDLVKTFTGGMGRSFTESFVAWSRGAEDFGVAFGRMAESVVADMERLVIQKLVVDKLMGVVSSAITPTRTPSVITGFSGVSETHYYDGGKSKLAAPAPEVVVVNATGAPTRSERTKGPNGRDQIRVIVGEAVAADLAEGGRVSRALEQHYGARRAPRRGS